MTSTRRSRLSGRFLIPILFVLSGCGIHSADRVVQIAQQAEYDPRKVDQLIKALNSRDEVVWNEAYVSLVKLGPAAVEPLKRAIRKGHPAGGRALLVMGEMCEPALFPFIQKAMDLEEYRRYAEEAFNIAEQPLYKRMVEERGVALCDAYLQWFPQGSYREKATLLRHEILGEEAWSALGRKPQDAQILAFLQRYGDTGTGMRARQELTSRFLVDASRELGRGRHQAALEIVNEARRLDPDLDADAMEAAIRFAIGKEAAEEARYEDAVTQLEQALVLGGGGEVGFCLGANIVKLPLFEAGKDIGGRIDRSLSHADPVGKADVSNVRVVPVESVILPASHTVDSSGT